MEIIFSIIVLIMSAVVHEVSHGYMALALGDRTAQYQGRLTLNPVKHLDVFGSIIFPLLLAILPGGFIFGWAKPVPYNPYNLKNRRWGEFLVAIAGPFSNLFIAFIFGIFIKFGGNLVTPSFYEISMLIVIINVVLAIFNLIPIPPLDGSKVLFSLLPQKYLGLRETIEKQGFFLIIIFIFFIWKFFTPLIFWLVKIFTGYPI
ncbi:site-2 protease family protein [Candidatus Nomurabacteria bacterium]|nr:site-2 protease family protein [Candidatus Nomurabacteria bacterium]